MDKKLLLIAVGVSLAIVGGFTYLLLREKPANVPVMQVDKTPPANPGNPPAEPSTPGVYMDYTPELLATAPGKKILFFHAPWCPQCRQLDKEIRTGSLPNNLNIFKVDYDSNQALRQKYGVQLQTTFVVVDDAGNAVKVFVAYDNPTLASLQGQLF